jgi:hypothetical protein
MELRVADDTGALIIATIMSTRFATKAAVGRAGEGLVSNSRSCSASA